MINAITRFCESQKLQERVKTKCIKRNFSTIKSIKYFHITLPIFNQFWDRYIENFIQIKYC